MEIKGTFGVPCGTHRTGAERSRTSKGRYSALPCAIPSTKGACHSPSWKPSANRPPVGCRQRSAAGSRPRVPPPETGKGRLPLCNPAARWLRMQFRKSRRFDETLHPHRDVSSGLRVRNLFPILPKAVSQIRQTFKASFAISACRLSMWSAVHFGHVAESHSFFGEGNAESL